MRIMAPTGITVGVISAALLGGAVYGLAAHYEGFTGAATSFVSNVSSSGLFWILLIAAGSTAGSKHLLIDLRERLLFGCILYFAWKFVLYVAHLPFRPPYAPNV